MFKLFWKLLISGSAVFACAYLLPGVSVSSFWTALLVVLLVVLLNIFVKPGLIFLSLPLTILTLGLFTLIIDTAVLFMAAFIVPGFHIDTFLIGLLFALVLSVVSSLFHKLLK